MGLPGAKGTEGHGNGARDAAPPELPAPGQARKRVAGDPIPADPAPLPTRPESPREGCCGLCSPDRLPSHSSPPATGSAPPRYLRGGPRAMPSLREQPRGAVELLPDVRHASRTTAGGSTGCRRSGCSPGGAVVPITRSRAARRGSTAPAARGGLFRTAGDARGAFGAAAGDAMEVHGVVHGEAIDRGIRWQPNTEFSRIAPDRASVLVSGRLPAWNSQYSVSFYAKGG